MADVLAVKDFDEIVFEHRNRQYGAYELRKRYNRNMNMAFLIAMGVFLLGVSIPAISRYLSSMSEDEVVMNKEVDIELKDLPEDLDEPPPPPPPDPPPPVQETIKFTPPVIVEEVKEEDIPPPVESAEKTAVDVKTQEGTGDVIDLPSEGTGEEKTDEFANQVFTIVEQMPEFPGGDAERNKFLKENLKYPQIAKEAHITGTVYVSFVVEPDGRITDVKALRGLGGGLTEEALRVVKKMPQWTSGRQNGRAVRVAFTLPINFKLQ